MDSERLVFWLVCVSIFFTSFIFPVVILLLVIWRNRRRGNTAPEADNAG